VAEPINFRVQFEGTDKAKRDLDQVSSSVQNLGRKEQEASRATDQLVDKQEAASRSSQQVTQSTQAQSLQVIALTQKLSAASNAIQTLTASFGGESEAAGLIGKIAASSAATAQLGASLGPQGALVGGILGAAIPAFQALIEQMGDTRDYAEGLQEELQRVAASFDDILSRRQRAVSQAARERFLEGGGGTVAEQEALVELRRGQLAAVEARIREAEDEARGRIFGSGEVDENVMGELQRQAAAATRQLTQARFALQSAMVEAEVDASELMAELQESSERAEETARRSRRGGARRVDQGDEAERLRAEEEQRKLLLRIEADSAVKQERINELLRQENEERQRTLELIRAEAEAQRQRDQEERTRQREQRRIQDELKMKLDEASKAAVEAAKAQQDQIKSVNEVIIKGFVDAISAVIAGQEKSGEAFKAMLAGFLAYVSEMAAIEAALNFAQAIASFAQNRIDAGVQHIAAGVAFTAVAVAAGAGAAALSPPEKKSKSEPEEGKDSKDRGGGQVIINWNAPVVTATTRAELGREMGHMIRAGAARYG
jgi:DNA repair exonuclease SbcCD ATPase subunit